MTRAAVGPRREAPTAILLGFALAVATISFAAIAWAAPAASAASGSGGVRAATTQPHARVAPTTPAVEDDPLTVEVLTFGPGGHPFTRFGHNAIRMVDRNAGTDIVYNFGTFSFGSPRLIVDFLQGRLHYWLSRSSMAATARAYQRENRSIESQELDLSPAQKRELATRLEVNARPENREYHYDYFADNCSTRVRDALDNVVQGRLKASAAGQGTMSLRAHALRMAADDLPFYLALMIVLGPRTDRPTNEWAEAFLPEMLQRTLRGSPTGDVGVVAGRLVKTERVLFKADRSPPRREAPNWLPAFLGVGAITGLLLFLLARAGARFWPARVLFGVALACAGLVAGAVGCFLAGAWALTPHAVVYRNENVLLFAPFAIALAVLGPGVAMGRPGATRKAFFVAAAALGLAGTACALKLFPWSHQENGGLILMMVPLWFGITAGTRAVMGLAPKGRTGA